MCSEVKRANSDLEGECFSFHVCDKQRHLRVLRIYSFLSLLVRLKAPCMLAFIFNNPLRRLMHILPTLTGFTCSEVMQLSHHTIKTHECTLNCAISDCQLQTITDGVYGKNEDVHASPRIEINALQTFSFELLPIHYLALD